MTKAIELIVLVVLIAVTYYFYKKSKAQADAQKATDTPPMEEISKYVLTVKIDGMMCEKCAARVTEGLSEFGKISINLDEKTATIESDELADAVAVEEKINELGYKFEGIVD